MERPTATIMGQLSSFVGVLLSDLLIALPPGLGVMSVFLGRCSRGAM